MRAVWPLRVAVGADAENVEAMAVGAEAFGLGKLLDGVGDALLEGCRWSDVGDLAAVDTEKVVVVLGEVLGKLEASELVIGGDAPNEPGDLQVEEMAVRRAARQVREPPGDVTDTDGVACTREQIDAGSPAGRVPLIDAAKASFGQVVQRIGLRVSLGVQDRQCTSPTSPPLVMRLSLMIASGGMLSFSTRQPARRRWRLHRAASAAVLLTALAMTVAGCGSRSPSSSSTPGVINAIGAENEYANVLSQIGGRYVHVSSILNNPNTDPHTFEANPQVAEEVSAAELIVQNGVGYDTFMNKIESASPDPKRKVIIVQQLLGLPGNTPNPHLWYSPKTMPAAAKAMAAALAELEPAHAAYFQANLAKFDASLEPWFAAIAAFKAKYAGTPAATTEPVADYMLQAMGIDNLTPFGFQADIMNGVDPAPEDISLEEGFFTKHQVKVFCYNQQVVDALTTSIRLTAIAAGVPVVGVYETMPTPGYDYQSWMLAELNAIKKAVTDKVSTEHL